MPLSLFHTGSLYISNFCKNLFPVPAQWLLFMLYWIIIPLYARILLLRGMGKISDTYIIIDEFIGTTFSFLVMLWISRYLSPRFHAFFIFLSSLIFTIGYTASVYGYMHQEYNLFMLFGALFYIFDPSLREIYGGSVGLITSLWIILSYSKATISKHNDGRLSSR